MSVATPLLRVGSSAVQTRATTRQERLEIRRIMQRGLMIAANFGWCTDWPKEVRTQLP